ncbi:MAG: IS110 family transposase [Alphaproteobacteria bacterium]|uniref:IS110 family transposase n=1 Tax=Candidatus Nitrobium versatile TaxID=2884831 RepID=A0A953M3E7_9BACT|nr:IS110 family transposase [Candidatus Nitrobium versatile]
MYTLFVGIDVSKDTFSATGFDAKGEVRFTLSVPMDQSGFAALLKAIRARARDLTTVMAAMESTGCYHINLFSFLCNRKITTVVLNPLLIFNFAKLSLRKTKTDKKDSLTIARFLLVHKDSIEQFTLSQPIKDLRELARERESLTHLIAATKNEIKRLVQTTFPELEGMANVFTTTMLLFLKEYPSACLIKTAGISAVAGALERSGRDRRVSVSAEDIIAAAKRPVASFSAARELILPEKISTLLHLMEQVDHISDMLTEMCQSMVIEEMQIITSIDGIGDTAGAAFLAEIGAIDNFPSAKALIVFAGLDPTVYQSGKFEGTSRISKRGNRHLRRIIYLMALGVIRVNKIFREYFLMRRKNGLPYRKAVLATAHKLVRVIFAMLSHKSCFRAKENSL